MVDRTINDLLGFVISERKISLVLRTREIFRSEITHPNKSLIVLPTIQLLLLIAQGFSRVPIHMKNKNNGEK